MAATADDQLTQNRHATVARLVSGMAHDVNNVLQVISGSVELLMALPDLPEPVRTALLRIAAQSARGAATLNGVAAVARPVGQARAIVDLRDIAAGAIRLKQYSVARAGLTLAVKADDHSLDVSVDVPQMLQILVNLIENAEQALSGRPAGHIVVATARDGPFACVSVSDDGPGLSFEIASHIFEPYVTTRPRPDSVGLGLPVARAIALAHDGTLSLEPADTGATFVLRVPLVSRDSPATASKAR